MTHYFDPEQTDSLACFASLLESMLKKHTPFHDLVLLCIGSDRATGDSLGPLLGHRLQQGRLLKKMASISMAHWNTRFMPKIWKPPSVIFSFTILRL